MSTRATGDRAEALAARHLEGLGYRILARNYRVKIGELDLVAEDKGVLCFVEVRSRADSTHGRPEETIDRSKRRRVARAAAHWLMTAKREDDPCRFDVVAVEGGQIRLYRDAFRLNDC